MKAPLANLRAFEAAARLLSFTLAAEELHLSQSAVSQQIKQLEERLGFSLFTRLTRRLELNEAGRRLYETVRRSLLEIDRTVEDLRDGTMTGSVTLSVGSSFAANWLIPRLGDLAARCPGIDLGIRPSDVLIDLPAEPDVDIAVRFGQGGGRGVVSRPLGDENVFVVCSPSLLDGVEPPGTLADLSGFPLLHNQASEQEPGAAGDWRNWLAALDAEGAVDVEGGPRFPRSDLLVRAAVLGQGMALAWDTMVANERRDGRLIKPFDGRYEISNRYYASCTEEAYTKPKVRAVLEWLTEGLA